MPRNWSWHVAAVCGAYWSNRRIALVPGMGMDVDTKDSGTSKMTQQGDEVDKP
jgi:hypothetical protein